MAIDSPAGLTIWRFLRQGPDGVLEILVPGASAALLCGLTARAAFSGGTMRLEIGAARWEGPRPEGLCAQRVRLPVIVKTEVDRVTVWAGVADVEPSLP